MKTWQVQDKLAQKPAHYLLSVETVPNILNPHQIVGLSSEHYWKYFAMALLCFRTYLRNTTNFYSIIPNFDKVTLRYIKHDYFMNFYISLEKGENSQYLCNSKRDLRII